MIVGWSTALRGQVIIEVSGNSEETGSRPAPAGKDQIITQRIGDETGWTTARSLGELGQLRYTRSQYSFIAIALFARVSE